jgi:pimeloyl-ACP methyl ester carboxylesterase
MGEAVGIRLARKLTVRQQIRRAIQPRVLRGLMKRQTRRRYLRVAGAKGRHLLRPLTSHATQDLQWVSERFLHELDAVVTRRIPVLFVYGAEDDFYEDFQAAARGRLGAILHNAEDRARLEVLDGSLHSSPSMRTQEACIDAIVRWFEGRASADVEVNR